MKDAGIEENLELVYEVSLLNILRHLEVFCSTPSGHNVEGAESDCDSIAKLGAQFKCIYPTWEIGQLDYLGLCGFMEFRA